MPCVPVCVCKNANNLRYFPRILLLLNSILLFLQHTVSQVAFFCEDYRRALFYEEQALKKDPSKLQDQLSYLQHLYVALNDLDSVIAVTSVRNREPTMSEFVCESFAKGKVEVMDRKRF